MDWRYPDYGDLSSSPKTTKMRKNYFSYTIEPKQNFYKRKLYLVLKGGEERKSKHGFNKRKN